MGIWFLPYESQQRIIWPHPLIGESLQGNGDSGLIAISRVVKIGVGALMSVAEIEKKS
jgi:hypothetical protein